MAGYYGIDVGAEPELLWVLREAVETSLPPDWVRCDNGEDEGYRNEVEGTESVLHPAHGYFRDLLQHERDQSAQNGHPLRGRPVWMMFEEQADGTGMGPAGGGGGSGPTTMFYFNFSTGETRYSPPDEIGGGSGGGECAGAEDGRSPGDLVLMRPERDKSVSAAIRLKRSVRKGAFDSIGRPPPVHADQLEVLSFKSWWNEGGNNGVERRYVDVHFSIATGNFQVLLDGSDKVYTLSHIQNGPRGGEALEGWDLHVGAKIDVLGRKTTLMQANGSTTNWLEHHRRALSKLQAKLESELQKYDRSFQSKAVQSRLVKSRQSAGAIGARARRKPGGANLRALMNNIEFLHDRLAHFRPKLALSIMGKKANDVFAFAAGQRSS